jgi:hypothetical protein
VGGKPHIETTMLGHHGGVIVKARWWTRVQFPNSSCKLSWGVSRSRFKISKTYRGTNGSLFLGQRKVVIDVVSNNKETHDVDIFLWDNLSVV